jgi:hypothetical protein
MTIIPYAFYLIMAELAVGAFLTMYALDIRNDSAINFFRTQGVIYFFLFSVLAWATQNGFATPHQLRLDGFNLDYSWLDRRPSLLGWFLLAQIPYNVALWFNSRIGRLAFGGIASFLGLAALFADAMGLRPVASAWGGGFFTVTAFLLGALALGGVSTAMLLGHWYLNTPTASGKPLEFATWLTIGGLVLQVFCGLLTGPTTYHATPAKAAMTAPQATGVLAPASAPHSHWMLAAEQPALTATPTVTPVATPTPPKPSVPSGVTFPTPILVLLQYVLGLGVPLGLSILALRLERDRSFQSATGMLYIAVVFTFFGEILARGLFLRPLA